MAESNISSDRQLIARIDRLERSARRWKAATLGLGATAIATVAGFGAVHAPPEKVTASGFEVADGEGKVRARLALSKEGEPALELLDSAGVAQVTLALGSFPRVEDRDRPTRLPGGRRAQPSDAALTSILRLGMKDGEPAVELGAGERLRALRLRDDFGDERMEFRVGPYVRPDLKAGATGDLVEATMRLKSPDERLAMELGVEPISMARPADRRGNARGPLVEEATPYLTMYGWREQPIFLLSNWAGDEPSLDLWQCGNGERSLLSVPDERHAAENDVRDGARREPSQPSRPESLGH